MPVLFGNVLPFMICPMPFHPPEPLWQLDPGSSRPRSASIRGRSGTAIDPQPAVDPAIIPGRSGLVRERLGIDPGSTRKRRSTFERSGSIRVALGSSRSGSTRDRSGSVCNQSIRCEPRIDPGSTRDRPVGWRSGTHRESIRDGPGIEPQRSGIELDPNRPGVAPGSTRGVGSTRDRAAVGG